MKATVTPLYRWGVYEYHWGTAVKEQRTGKWTNILLKPSGQMIEVDHINVEIHENGIEFIVK